MLEIKVAIQLASLRLPLKQALLTAAQLGAQAVEIDARNELRPAEMTRTAVRQVRKMLEDLNLRVCALSFRTRRGYDVAEDLERRIEATKGALKLAFDLGAPVVVNAVGRVPPPVADDAPPDPGWHRLVDSLHELGRFGQHVGATVAADTGGESGADLARLVAALPPAYLGVNFNPGNLIINQYSVGDAVRSLAPHVLHVHATDGVRDRAQGRGVSVPLGRGSVDFAEVFSVLEEQQYRGYFTVVREQSDQPLLEIGAAVKYLQAI